VLITSNYQCYGTLCAGNVIHQKLVAAPNLKTTFDIMFTIKNYYIFYDGTLITVMPKPYDFENVSKFRVVNIGGFFSFVNATVNLINQVVVRPLSGNYAEILILNPPYKVDRMHMYFSYSSISTCNYMTFNTQPMIDGEYILFLPTTSAVSEYIDTYNLKLPICISFYLSVLNTCEYMQICAFDSGLEFFISSGALYFLASKWKEDFQIIDCNVALSIKKGLAVKILDRLQLNEVYFISGTITDSIFIFNDIQGKCGIKPSSYLYLGNNTHDSSLYINVLENYNTHNVVNDSLFKIKKFNITRNKLV